MSDKIGVGFNAPVILHRRRFPWLDIYDLASRLTVRPWDRAKNFRGEHVWGGSKIETLAILRRK